MFIDDNIYVDSSNGRYYTPVVIRSKLRRLRLEKEERERRKLPYRVIAEETRLSQGVLVRLMNSEFERVEVPTLNALCQYFGCGIGDLLEYVSDDADLQDGEQQR